MQTLFILLQAQSQQGGGWSFIIMLVAMFAIMWLFMIRPQQKKQKEIQKWRNQIAKGTEVVTAGGIYGTVRNINEAENTLTVEISKGVNIRIDKGSVYASASSANQSAGTEGK